MSSNAIIKHERVEVPVAHTPIFGIHTTIIYTNANQIPAVPLQYLTYLPSVTYLTTGSSAASATLGNLSAPVEETIVSSSISTPGNDMMSLPVARMTFLGGMEFTGVFQVYVPCCDIGASDALQRFYTDCAHP